MPLYEYECPEHGRFLDEERGDAVACQNPVDDDLDLGVPLFCGRRSKRKFSFSLKPIMQSHMNPSVGTMISDEKQLKERLKIKSEERTMRLGIEHNFQPVDVRDKEALGVTDAGLEATERRKVEEGRVEPKKFFKVTDD